MKYCYKIEDIQDSNKPVHKIQENIRAAKITWVSLLGGITATVESTENETAYSVGVETPQGYPTWRLKKELTDALVGVEGVTLKSVEPNPNYAGLWRVIFMYEDEKIFNSRKAA